MNSPTQRSLAVMRERGYLCDVVERWIPGANVRRDLFGMFDLVAIKGAETCAVQTTSAGNVSARVRKIAEHANLDAVRKAGWTLLVHGWAKRKGRWQLREVDVS